MKTFVVVWVAVCTLSAWHSVEGIRVRQAEIVKECLEAKVEANRWYEYIMGRYRDEGLIDNRLFFKSS